MPDDTHRLAPGGGSVASTSALVVALWLTVVVQCISLALVSGRYDYFHMYFNWSDPFFVATSVVIFSALSILFVVAEFSFGYVIGFTFFIIVMNFTWLSYRSRFDYDHAMVIVLVVSSFLLFLMPALLFGSRRRIRWTLPSSWFPVLLVVLTAIIGAVLVVAATYNFRVVGLGSIYEFRNEVIFPTALNYSVNVVINALAPYVFACWIERRNYICALCIVLLLLAFYPVTLSKGALFAPFWLVVLTLVMREGSPRLRFVAVYLAVVAIGVVAAFVQSGVAISYFGAVNFRLLAIPASVIEHYIDYFQTRPNTGLCHVGFMQQFLKCLSVDQLSVVMNNHYNLGNQNGSFLATEGVAAFGYYFMPIAALLCGAIVGLGNVASAGLSARFVLLSGGMMPLVMNNVPMSTTLFTGGYLVLILLWMISPRMQDVLVEAR